MIRTLLVVLVVLVSWQVYRDAHTGAQLDVIQQTLEIQMATLTFTKTLDDGTVVTYTATQNQGETLAAFAARARAEWEEILSGLGD